MLMILLTNYIYIYLIPQEDGQRLKSIIKSLFSQQKNDKYNPLKQEIIFNYFNRNIF